MLRSAHYIQRLVSAKDTLYAQENRQIENCSLKAHTAFLGNVFLLDVLGSWKFSLSASKLAMDGAVLPTLSYSSRMGILSLLWPQQSQTRTCVEESSPPFSIRLSDTLWKALSCFNVGFLAGSGEDVLKQLPLRFKCRHIDSRGKGCAG